MPQSENLKPMHRIFFTEPDAREDRPQWIDVPQDIIHKIENLIGEKITHGQTAWGGYSPSACFVVTGNSQKKYFLKGSWPHQTTHGAQTLRQEIDVYKALPILSDIGAPYIGYVGEEDEDGWHLAVFDYIEHIKKTDLSQQQAEHIIDRLCFFYRHTEDQKNVVPDARSLNFVKDHFDPQGRWQRLAIEQKTQNKFLTLFKDKEAAESWAQKNIPVLVKWQNQVSGIGGYSAVTHNDLRCDNILLAFDTVHFVDWPNAAFGPVVFDLVTLFSDMASQSDLNPQDLLNLFEQKSGQKIKKQDLILALVSLSGYFADMAYRSVPARLPRLRWMQKRLLAAQLYWLADLDVVAPPPDFNP